MFDRVPAVLLMTGDVLARLADLPDESVHCIVTSPPYYGLRNYGTATWSGGDSTCDHQPPDDAGKSVKQTSGQRTHPGRFLHNTCPKCGATKTDSQIGLEESPVAYVDRLVTVFRELRRVLRADGTAWLVIGDSYATSPPGRGPTAGVSGLSGINSAKYQATLSAGHDTHAGTLKSAKTIGLKNKDLIGIPWRLAFALQGDGWWLRSGIVYAKNSCMPESIRDRPTTSHEYIFLLTKNESYFFDSFAIAEPSTSDHPSGNGFKRSARLSYTDARGPRGDDTEWTGVGGTRNSRSVWRIEDEIEQDTVWTINPEPFRGAHFATFPSRLASRAIAAGTSDYGCCQFCGAPFARIVEKLEADEAHMRACGADASGGYSGTAVKDYAAGGAQDASATKARILAGMKRKVTTGWSRSCKCPDASPMPATVLDPFSGAGTTALSATRLGRDAIGIDLNTDYNAIANVRLTDLKAKCLDTNGNRLPFRTASVTQA